MRLMRKGARAVDRDYSVSAQNYVDGLSEFLNNFSNETKVVASTKKEL